jgi:excisionase family DNA binding protein
VIKIPESPEINTAIGNAPDTTHANDRSLVGPGALDSHGNTGMNTQEQTSSFMNVKQVAEYLQLNEKKIYALANDGNIPGTKITGKWLFPKTLIDHWLIESSHGGILTDRLTIAGSDDPLLDRIVVELISDFNSDALVSYTATGTAMGLSLLGKQRINVCAIHWGPVEESHVRHAALIQQYPESSLWIIVRLFRREQGFMLSPKMKVKCTSEADVFFNNLTWVTRSDGAGSQRFLLETATRLDSDIESLNIALTVQTEREAASALAQNHADVAPGPRSVAQEFGLEFISSGWEAYDLVLPRTIYFRQLFQSLLAKAKQQSIKSKARQFGGYDLKQLGKVIWSP